MEEVESNSRRAYRPAEGIVLAGVCAGLAENLRIPVLWVRLAFAAGVFFNGVSIVAYVILWRFMPLAVPHDGEAPPRQNRKIELAQSAAIGAVIVGLVLLFVSTGAIDVSSNVALIALVVVGIAVVWRLLDEATMNKWITGTSGFGFWLRLLAGLALIVLGLVALISTTRGFDAIVDIGAAFVLAVLGGVLLIGPWAMKLRSDLAAERIARARSQERADVAAHLHDSVLQTLALLQKNAKDPALVATMARRQERELRAWLLGLDEDPARSMAAALRDAAGSVEDTYHVPVELVIVGDSPMDDQLAALLAAGREAIVNAAKHSQASKIDVYVEIQSARVDLFVRDRGQGFDPGQVAADRRGIEESIIARMVRHGGEADITSAPGEGTEVRMSLVFDAQEDA